MSGHNKWSKIKHKKAATDAQKSKIFGKLVRLIQVEAKKNAGNIESSGLRLALEKANKANMPKDNIDRAIKKGNESGGDMQEVLFEVYGPAGIGMIITGLTDNNNRTSQEIKHILSKNGGSLGAAGSVSWNFSQNKERDWVANSTISVSPEDGEKLEKLIEAIEEQDDIQDIYVNAE